MTDHQLLKRGDRVIVTDQSETRGVVLMVSRPRLKSETMYVLVARDEIPRAVWLPLAEVRPLTLIELAGDLAGDYERADPPAGVT